MSNKSNPKFTINNFRIFDKPHTFELAPITILTGPNNSGKSSLVKALLMLKNDKNVEEISYQINLPNKSLELPGAHELLNKVDESFDFSFSFSHLHHNFQFSLSLSRDLGFPDNKLYFDSIAVSSNGKIVLDIDNIENFSQLPKFDFDFKFWLGYLKNGFIAVNSIKNLQQKHQIDYKKKYKDVFLFELEYEGEVFVDISKEIRLKFNEIQNQLINDIVEINEHVFDASLLVLLLEYRLKKDSLNEKFGNSNNTIMRLFQERFQTLIIYFQFELQKQINIHIPGNFNLKKTEFYSHFEEFSKEFIDLIGFEMSVFTDIEVLPVSKGLGSRNFQPDDFNLPFISKIVLKFSNSSEDLKVYWFNKWVNEWLGRFELGKSLDFINIENRDIYTIEIIDFQDKRRNIKDLGFGVSQIVSLLLSPFITDFRLDDYASEMQYEINVDKFEYYDKAPIFYLEEPESNLHPNWQSLLMELITDINQTFGIHFIIETHSEYMMRKLQFLMADKTKNLETDSALIYYFNSDKNVDESKGEPKIKKIKIDKNGALSDNFGPGFYDEAINIQFDLLKLNKHQSN